MTYELKIGFLPLVDACLPILAQENGFAEDEGLSLRFQRDVSWATVLDRLLYGHTDAAHMLAPLAIATTLGRSRPAQALASPFVLGLNGNAITVSLELADQLALDDGLAEPVKLGERLKTVAEARKTQGRPLRIGVVHRYSSHNLMLRYWLRGCGIAPGETVELVTIGPPFAAEALASGEIDATCVGEPWNSVAVERGVGRIVLATSQIWRRGVEKVLTLREEKLEAEREPVEKLVRAMRRAGAHFVDPANWESNAAILAGPDYLDGSAELIMHAISDQLVLARGSDPVTFPDFMFQYAEAANFPWVSQARWIYSQMVLLEGGEIDSSELEKATRVFRPDVYRTALSDTGDILPGANSKLEGSLANPTEVAGAMGAFTLKENQFFDRRVFDPDDVAGYLKGPD